MKFMLTMILAMLIGGCQWTRTSSENEPIVHGYETEDGTVVNYTVYDNPGNGGSDRAVAK